MKFSNIPQKVSQKITNMTQQFYYSIMGSTVQCNICGYKAAKLESDDWHLYCGCPKCNTGLRHRLLWAALTFPDNKNLIANKKVLHFAPDSAIKQLIKKTAAYYKTADFVSDSYYYSGIDYNIDMSAMPTIINKSFDCIIACDVLEHIADDKAALKEVYRVLSDDGCCIFTIPQKDHTKNTVEDLSNLSPSDREKKFGVADHWRIYGSDFKELLESAGFQVNVIDETNFTDSFVAKHVLSPPIPSEKSLATNFRKIYFGKKITK